MKTKPEDWENIPTANLIADSSPHPISIKESIPVDILVVYGFEKKTHSCWVLPNSAIEIHNLGGYLFAFRRGEPLEAKAVLDGPLVGIKTLQRLRAA